MCANHCLTQQFSPFHFLALVKNKQTNKRCETETDLRPEFKRAKITLKRCPLTESRKALTGLANKAVFKSCSSSIGCSTPNISSSKLSMVAAMTFLFRNYPLRRLFPSSAFYASSSCSHTGSTFNVMRVSCHLSRKVGNALNFTPACSTQ